MENTRSRPRPLTEDVTRLIAALPQVRDLPAEDPLRVAWIAWKLAVLDRIERLEAWERHIQGSGDLWIELSREDAERAVFDNAESRDTPADL